MENYQEAIFSIVTISQFKKKALCWAQQFETCCLLDHNAYPNGKEKVTDGVLAISSLDYFQHQIGSGENGFGQLNKWLSKKKDWAFGFLSYDLKNEIENLQTTSKDFHQFPLLHFFRPQLLIHFAANEITIRSKTLAPKDIFLAIQSTALDVQYARPNIHLQSNFSREEYLQTIRKIKSHISLGDIYEMNFCQSFFAEEVKIDPLNTFLELNELSAAPFASYFKLNDNYLLCGSPERFLKKEGKRLLSQPIKGTRPRKEDKVLDQLEVDALINSPKDKSENVMIVDLVRNDLARSCQPGSILVEELFGIYTFKAVHQMISTISGELRPAIEGLEALRLAFPMGSMTGAPKIRAMQLIDQYERSARGLYSGSVGYFTPTGDFDFNVVIRSILYEAEAKRLSFPVGGAIVADSQAEEEYEECMVKAKTMMQVLGLQPFMLNAE